MSETPDQYRDYLISLVRNVQFGADLFYKKAQHKSSNVGEFYKVKPLNAPVR